MEKPNKFLFANQLRGIAVFSVLLSHWFGMYWARSDLVAQYTASPQELGSASFLYFWVSNYSHFNFGAFGVAVFFLISGFVIPFSLEKLNPLSFLTARVFRIFPTYIFGLALSLFFVYLSGQFWEIAFPWGKGTMAANALLVFNLLGIHTIDLVNWTLAIEIKFYLLLALMIPLIRQGKVWMFFAWAVLIFLVNWKVQGVAVRLAIKPLNTALYALSIEMMYVTYMMIGVLFYYQIKNKISQTQLFIYSGILLAIVALTWKVSTVGQQFPVTTANYLWGYIAFTTAYLLRDKFKPIKALDWLANVSYPMYAMHSLIGYTFIKLLCYYGIGFELASLITFGIVGIIAQLIHSYIEKPSTEYGKRLAARVG